MERSAIPPIIVDLSLVDESEKIIQLAGYLFGSILKGDKVLTSNHICSQRSWYYVLLLNVVTSV